MKLAAALRFTATALTGVQREEIERQRLTAAAALTALGRWTVQDHAFVVVLIVTVPLPVLWVNMAAGVRMNGATSL